MRRQGEARRGSGRRGLRPQRRPLTFGRLASKQGEAWQVDQIVLLFSPDDAVQVAPSQTAFTKAFGAPQDATTGTTVLIWRGRDRVARVTAEVPAEEKKLVYAVIIARR